MGFGAADLFAWRRYVSGWRHMPEGCGGDNKNAGRSACSVSSPIGLDRMYHKNAGAEERNKQHRARPLKLTARWCDDGKRLSVSGRFRRFQKMFSLALFEASVVAATHLALGCLKPRRRSGHKRGKTEA